MLNYPEKKQILSNFSNFKQFTSFLKEKAEAGLSYLLSLVPLSCFMNLSITDFICFNYHMVTSKEVKHISKLFSYKNPVQFEQDLIFIKDKFNPISYTEILEAKNLNDLPENPVLLTFDDGLREGYTVIRPLLLKHNIPGLFFINTNFIENQDMSIDLKASLILDHISNLPEVEQNSVLNKIENLIEQQLKNLNQFEHWLKYTKKNAPTQIPIDELGETMNLNLKRYLNKNQPYLNKSEVLELKNDGFYIGAHGNTHANIGSLPVEKAEQAVVKSCNEVKNWINQDKVPFAFPYSANGISKDFIETLQSKYNFISHFFDTRGTNNKLTSLLQRIGADKPSKTLKESNLGSKIKVYSFKTFLKKLLDFC